MGDFSGFINFVSEIVIPGYYNVAVELMFLGIGISTFAISVFFYRYAHEYRSMYITAQQHFTYSSIGISVTPIISSLLGALYSAHGQFYYGIATISSILSVFYPLLLHSKIVALGSFFPFSLLFTCLINDFPSTVSILYTLAILSLAVRFTHESRLITSIYRRIFIPFLLFDTIGILLEGFPFNINITDKLCIYSGFTGAFIGFLMEKFL